MYETSCQEKDKSGSHKHARTSMFNERNAIAFKELVAQHVRPFLQASVARQTDCLKDKRSIYMFF